MSKATLKVSETERERKELLDEIAADLEGDGGEQYEPGSFGCHELLDRTALAADLVERYVLTQPACVQNAEWYELADQAVSALRELYQRVGAAHLDA